MKESRITKINDAIDTFMDKASEYGIYVFIAILSIVAFLIKWEIFKFFVNSASE